MKTAVSLLFVLATLFSNAQKSNGAVAMNAGAGFSFFGIFGSVDLKIQDEFDIESESTPAWIGSIDFGFDNHISIGVGGGYQSVASTYRDYAYIDEDGNEQIGEFSYGISRLNIGSRILFHYGNGNIDAYSGIKPGLNIWEFSSTSTTPIPSWVQTSGSTFAFQVIPIGVRAYFTNNIGIFFETGIGSPTFVSGGICLGFGEQRDNTTTN